MTNKQKILNTKSGTTKNLTCDIINRSYATMEHKLYLPNNITKTGNGIGVL